MWGHIHRLSFMKLQISWEINELKGGAGGYQCFFCWGGTSHSSQFRNTNLEHSETVKHRNTLKYTETLWNTLNHLKTLWNTVKHSKALRNTVKHTETHWNTLKDTNTVKHSETHQNTETQWNTVQHRKTHWNTVKNCKTPWNTVKHTSVSRMSCWRNQFSQLQLFLSGPQHHFIYSSDSTTTCTH